MQESGDSSVVHSPGHGCAPQRGGGPDPNLTSVPVLPLLRPHAACHRSLHGHQL